MKVYFSHIRARLSKADSEILCSAITLSDAAGTPVLSGPGRLRFTSDGQVRFEMQTTLSQEQSRLLNSNHLRYAWHLEGLSFTAKDYDGLGYFGPITDAKFAQTNLANLTNVQVVGVLYCLRTTVACEPGPARAVVVFTPSFKVPLTTSRKTEVSVNGESERLQMVSAAHRFTTKGVTISVLENEAREELELEAMAGQGTYGHPYLEHLLTEPFRALNGAGQYPRYILRDLGTGEGFLTIVPQNNRGTASLGGARDAFLLLEPHAYWGYFTKYLDYLAEKYDERFYADPNPLTLFHDEVYKAVKSGSHWVVSLALCSAIEGMCRWHPAWRVEPSPVTAEERVQAVALVERLPSEFLRQKLMKALKAACNDQQPQGTPTLKALVEEGVIEPRHKKAWEEFRHRVVHGKLLDHRVPDSKLDVFPDLHELFQLLTAYQIGFSVREFPLNPHLRETLDSFDRSSGGTGR